MTIQDQIIQTVLSAKCTAVCWAMNNIDREKYGQDISCCEMRMLLLVKWTNALQSYYFDNYNGYVGQIEPTIDCLTADQATLLMGKINILIKKGCN